jgi:plasmid replication initiation protein
MEEYQNETLEILIPTEQVITPELLGEMPRYELKRNAIIRAAYDLSANAQKLVAMAFALLPLDLSVREVSFSFYEFCEAMGMSPGGMQYEFFKAAATECNQCSISLETKAVNRGKIKRIYEAFSFFSYVKVDEIKNVCTMQFSEKLVSALAELKIFYSKIQLKDIGKLQSSYAIRLAENAIGWQSEAGKNGNKQGEWYFKHSLVDWRFIFGVPPGAYKRSDNLKRYVFDEPIREINSAGLGLELKVQTIKTGRKITDIQINCKKVARKVTPCKGRGRKKAVAEPETALELPMEVDAPASHEEKELHRLRERYPEEFAELYAAELEKKTDWMAGGGEFKKKAAMVMACMKLRERHGIVK